MIYIEIFEDGEQCGHIDVINRYGEYEGNNTLVQTVVDDIGEEFVVVTHASGDRPDESLPLETERELTEDEIVEWASGLLELAGVEFDVHRDG